MCHLASSVAVGGDHLSGVGAVPLDQNLQVLLIDESFVNLGLVNIVSLELGGGLDDVAVNGLLLNSNFASQ